MPNVTDAESQAPNNGATWWCKILAKGVGVIAAIVCAICGITTFLSILHPVCIGAGALMLCISFLLILFEAPICCMFFESTKKVSTWIEKRQYWHKGLAYVIISIIPVAICPGIATFLGCICPFATGVIYGLMSLGKKADRNEMLASAGGGDFNRFENEP